jgi:hypothetical protein
MVDAGVGLRRRPDRRPFHRSMRHGEIPGIAETGALTEVSRVGRGAVRWR